MAQATCPGCGAPIEFKIGGPSSVVCKNCKSVAWRSDRGIESLGQVADVVFSDVALAVYDRGTFRGRPFEVSGRLMFRHPAGGSWEEYLAHFSDGTVGTIAEAQGEWTITLRVDGHPPPFQALSPGSAVHLGPHGDWVVDEKNVGTIIGGEGEIPFSAPPGGEHSFVDISGPGGARGSIDYGDGSSAPVVYVGTACRFEELGLERRGIERGEKVQTSAVACPSCGAPVPICAPGVTERIACRFCGAVSDLGKNEVISQQTRREPWIPLGSAGVLEGVTWLVIGYVERSADVEGETFGWSEYLLYEPSHGYRWLVYDEGTFLFGTPVAAGDVDLQGYPHVVRFGGTAFKMRNVNRATVNYVLGEFYWKVVVGETVHSEDFESRGNVLSSEQSDGENNWTFSKPLDAGLVRNAFNLVSASPPATRIEDIKTIDGAAFEALSDGPPGWVKLAILAVFCVVLVYALKNGSSDDDDSSGFRSTSGVVGVGGFGGK
ncbi:MAG: DUF4178 domain-containing protein, partial [Polyangiaceae bacterium]